MRTSIYIIGLAFVVILEAQLKLQGILGKELGWLSPTLLLIGIVMCVVQDLKEITKK